MRLSLLSPLLLTPALRQAGRPQCVQPPCDDENSFAAELTRRGFRTALDDLAADGPSAFKNPEKVIEYVMMSLQHNGAQGVAEAFRFTSPLGGKQSFVSGNPLSTERVSWQHGVVIEGYVSGRALSFEDFKAMIAERYGVLVGCAVWSFAALHPSTFSPCFRDAENGFVKETTLLVDDVPIALRLIYEYESSHATCCPFALFSFSHSRVAVTTVG
ncbi:MAG: hypothetical protein SGPRY_008406, partial [Prymnesium sp.]